MNDPANRMKERRAPVPAFERTGVAPEWLMGIGILMVIVGVILVAVRMGSTFENVDYGWGPRIALIGIVLTVRGMSRAFRTPS